MKFLDRAQAFYCNNDITETLYKKKLYLCIRTEKRI